MTSRIPSKHLEAAYNAWVLGLYRQMHVARRGRTTNPERWTQTASDLRDYLNILLEVRRNARRDYVSQQNRSIAYFRQRQDEMAEEARDRDAEYISDQMRAFR